MYCIYFFGGNRSSNERVIKWEGGAREGGK